MENDITCIEEFITNSVFGSLEGYESIGFRENERRRGMLTLSPYLDFL